MKKNIDIPSNYLRLRSGVPAGALLLVMVLFWSAGVSAGNRWLDNGDGTVTDTVLGLMWAQKDNQFDINWKEAQHWVRFIFPDTRPDKRRGWRLPTLAELASLSLMNAPGQSRKTKCGHRVVTPPGISLSCGWVWSSERKSITARVYNFHHRYSYWERWSKQRGFRVLPVRFVND